MDEAQKIQIPKFISRPREYIEYWGYVFMWPHPKGMKSSVKCCFSKIKEMNNERKLQLNRLNSLRDKKIYAYRSASLLL